MKRVKLFIINNRSLYHDFLLIDRDFPEFYVCIDDYENRYLVLLVDSEEAEYIIIPITSSKLKQMICGEITVSEAFKTSDVIYFVDTEDDIPDNDKVSTINYNDVHEYDKEGWFDDEYYRLDKKFINKSDEYIKELMES